MTQTVRTNYGASLSPDATAFAHLVDDGGYPRAVQRFLRGWRASSSRDVELPVEGPVTRVIHSADGHWLACEVAPDGGTPHVRSGWSPPIPTTAPPAGSTMWAAGLPEGTAELIGWDGTQVAAILTGDDGVGSSCLIDPADGATDDAGPPVRRPARRRVGGRGADPGRSARLSRPDHAARADRNRLLPYDPGSTTDAGVILDDHSPRRLRSGLEGETFELYQPAKVYGVNSTDGFVRALIRSENGADHARLLEVTTTADGVSYQVVAERPGLRTRRVRGQRRPVHGGDAVEHQRRQRITDPRVRRQHAVRSDSAARHGGQRADHQRRRVDGGDDGARARHKPRTVELVDPRTREWERIDREPSSGPLSARADAGNHHRPRRVGVHRLAVPARPQGWSRSGR